MTENISGSPLSGKRIIVTRASEQREGLVHELERYGAEVVLLPLVAFQAPLDSGPLDRALGELVAFDWILFTSQNAVRFVASRLDQLGLGKSVRKIAALGPATAKISEEHGFPVDYVASQHTADSFAAEMLGMVHGKRVFLPQSDRADNRIAAALREGGAHVTDPVAYRTVTPEAPDPGVIERIRGGEVDIIIFASPSAFQNLARIVSALELAKLAEKIEYAAIGPTTARAMRVLGVRVHIEAEEASAAGLADAIVKHCQEREVLHQATHPILPRHE